MRYVTTEYIILYISSHISCKFSGAYGLKHTIVWDFYGDSENLSFKQELKEAGYIEVVLC